MSKTNNSSPKIYCERYKKHLRSYANAVKHRTMKKVVVSEKIGRSTEKSYSAGVMNNSRVTPKKITQSDCHLYDKQPNANNYCKTCGYYNKPCKNPSKAGKTYLNMSSLNKTTNKPIKNDLQQHYRNENYKSCDSINATDIRKYLNTITEQTEKVSKSESIFEIYSDSDEEFTLMDPNKDDNIQNIKEFRKENYFECHSAKSRINTGSVTSLNNHKCVYRFYLNDRLFPVSINTDYNNNVRCIECHLPLKSYIDLNGMIQAKVKINNELQDVLLMLPVKNSLIIKEKRKKENKKEDCLYFGIIKLDINGDSVFKRNLPANSLALRYQKGYKEFGRNDKYEYESIEKNDVIII